MENKTEVKLNHALLYFKNPVLKSESYYDLKTLLFV